jgi:DNA-binding beta-propeller fold protein YncE
MMIRTTLCRLLFLLLVAFSGCSSPIAKQGPIVYPPPPDDPKIVYLETYEGEADFATPSFLDRLFGVSAHNNLVRPFGVAAGTERVFVADTIKAMVFVIDTARKKVDYITEIDKVNGSLKAPLDVALDASENLYISDIKLRKIVVYDRALRFVTTFGKKGDFENPAGMAINNRLQRLYVADSYGHVVYAYSLKGERLFGFGTRGTGEGEFNYPAAIAIDRRNDNVYVVDSQNFRIQLFSKDGKFISQFGQVGDSPGDFIRPKGIGVDSEGNIYVADAAFDNVQIFNEKAKLVLPLGGMGREAGRFNMPAGLFIDEQDRIFVVDSLNLRVQRFQFLSEKWIKEHPEEFKKYVVGTEK